MAARSTTAGTPVKSWRRTRAGMNAISFCAPLGVHLARAAMSSLRTKCPSSQRRRFSRRVGKGMASLARCERRCVAFYGGVEPARGVTLELLGPMRGSNPTVHLCAYGLYAPLAAESLHAAGVESLFGGEFEQALVNLAEHLSGLSAFPQIHPLDSNVSLARLRFVTPDRSDLPSLKNYAHLVMPAGEHRLVGYTEPSRGCKHFCRHCPIVPVYNGVFLIVGRESVRADILQQA